MRLASLIVLIPLALGLPATAPARPELRVVPDLDLGRYAGRWFEIARLPNRFQARCAGEVTAVYTPRPDGRITVANRCRGTDGTTIDAVGVARRVDGRPASVLQVRFAPAFLSFLSAVWGDYQVIALDPQYRHAVVGAPDRQYLWVLSRTPQLEAGTLDALLAEARTQGFDTAKVVRTRQAQP